MPVHNAFRHQPYTRDAPTVPVYRVAAGPGRLWPAIPLDTATPSLIASADQSPLAYDAVYLVHGTFAGTDASGLLREVERWFPKWGPALRAHRKAWFDDWARDLGNYTEPFARVLEDFLARPTSPLADGTPLPAPRPVPVRRWSWSGENLHLGRAIGALQLLDELWQRAEQGEHHFLVWGHSHAGNVCALVTNLLTSARPLIDRFLEATALALRASRSTADSGAIATWWTRTCERLRNPALRPRWTWDIVTFGTPVRYGWDPAGVRGLVHVIHHRPATNEPTATNSMSRPDLAPFPLTWDDILSVRHGDYVQQLGIAGTNLTPLWVAWNDWRAEWRLAQLLQPGLRRRDTWRRWSIGMRVPRDGVSLLVDYPDDPRHLRQAWWGHAIYTSAQFLPFHAAVTNGVLQRSLQAAHDAPQRPE